MTINLSSLAHKVEALFVAVAPVAGVVAAASVGTPAGAIANVVLAIPQFIDLADELLVGVPGPVKLAAVKSSIAAAVNQVAPDAGAKFDSAWSLLGPAVSMIVTLKRFGIHF